MLERSRQAAMQTERTKIVAFLRAEADRIRSAGPEGMEPGAVLADYARLIELHADARR